MEAFKRLLILLIVMMIPMSAIIFSANVITRMPDVYSYEFTKSQINSDIGLESTAKELSELISDYLTGRISDFQIVAEYQGRERSVFTTAEQIGMEKIKELLNQGLLLALVFFVLTVIIDYMIITDRQKARIRNAFKLSIFVYLGIWFGILTLAISGIGLPLLQNLIFTGGFDSEGVLLMLLSGSFMFSWLLFTFIGASAILFIAGNITFRLTKERRMFMN